MNIAIAGKEAETINYVKYVEDLGVRPLVTLQAEEIARCDGLILPGGGDITPAFFGESNHGSGNIDTGLDILQLQALDLCIAKQIPVLGICKGLQIINVGLGGSIIQDLPTAQRHKYLGGDQYHRCVVSQDSWLYDLYGDSMIVNSAHHQGIDRLGRGLRAVQRCPDDNCIEAIAHDRLPLLGVQWHPERIDQKRAMISGEKVLAYFASLISFSRNGCCG